MRSSSGGDVVTGPMPQETLQRLLDFDRPVHFIHGNGELAQNPPAWDRWSWPSAVLPQHSAE